MNDAVLHVIPSVAPRDGGPSAAVIGMCRALNAAGCRAEIATTDADGSDRLPVERRRIVEHLGVPTRFFGRVASVSFKWSPGLAHWLRAHVLDYRLVHVHAVFSHAPIAAGRACRRAGVPYIVRPLGTLDPWSLAQRSWRKRVLLATGGRSLLEGAAAMHYTTADEAVLAAGAVGQLPRAVVVPVGIDDEWFDVRSRADTVTPCLVSLSRLDPKKGVDKLIAAFHTIAERPDARAWRLVIAGDGDRAYVAGLRRLASQGPGRERIEFPGWVRGADKRGLIETASLLVLPSQQENFGIAVAEALAAGVPVVLSPGVNLARAVQQASAGWISDSSIDALAATLIEAIGSEDERRRRGERARRLAQEFRWAAVGQRLMSAYDDVTRVSDAAAAGQAATLPARSWSRH